MKEKCDFVKITNAGLSESHVHDVEITREAPITEDDEYGKCNLWRRLLLVYRGES